MYDARRGLKTLEQDFEGYELLGDYPRHLASIAIVFMAFRRREEKGLIAHPSSWREAIWAVAWRAAHGQVQVNSMFPSLSCVHEVMGTVRSQGSVGSPQGQC